MKGIIFTDLPELAAAVIGGAAVDSLLDRVETGSGGACTAVGHFDRPATIEDALASNHDAVSDTRLER